MPEGRADKSLLVQVGAFAGVMAPVVFAIGVALAGFLKPDQSPMRDVISDLGAGPFAWVQNTNFSATGVLLIAFAVGFYPAMRRLLSSTRLTVATLLLVLSGLGFLVAAYFHVPGPDDPPAVQMRQGLLHMAGFLTIFIPLIAALFVVGWQLRREPAWRALGSYSVGTGVATLILVALLFITANPASSFQYAGLVSRILAVQALVWHAVISVRLIKDERVISS